MRYSKAADSSILIESEVLAYLIKSEFIQMVAECSSGRE